MSNRALTVLVTEERMSKMIATTEKLIAALKNRNYDVSYFDTKEQAAEHIAGQITGKTVGFGDSETLLSMKMYEKLCADETNEVYSPKHPPEGMSFNDVGKICLTTDIFLTSVNAVTQDGMLVNLDSTGNRVAGSLFGHEKVYFVLGTNKICADLDAAIDHVRNYVAPANSRRHGYSTPCAKGEMRCYECSSEDRICNALVIHYKKMKYTEAEVVLIGEELGL